MFCDYVTTPACARLPTKTLSSVEQADVEWSLERKISVRNVIKKSGQ